MNTNLDTGFTPTKDHLKPIDADQDDDRGNIVPWLALMVFKADDLIVPQDAADALGLSNIMGGKVADSTGSSQPTTTKIYNEQKQPASGAFSMTVGDYMSSITSKVYFPPHSVGDLPSSVESTSIIFPLKSMVKDVFGATTDLKGLKAQKLHSHVRQLNTVGFPDAGVQDEGYYSVVFSMMTGDLATSVPSNHVVHLVSIEHLDSTLTDPASSILHSDNSDRIGLVSLYTWTYQCIPEAVNFEIMMENLGHGRQPLRPPLEQLTALQAKANDTKNLDKAATYAASQLYDRLNAGYTIARWRAPSGEESIAFNRGPLVPVMVPEVPSSEKTNPSTAWPGLSMHGRDYAVLDENLGILDATYSAAWSLGRLVAVSDSVFNAALMRFRSSIWNESTSLTRKAENNVDDWSKVLASSVNAVSNGRKLASGDYSGDPSRINKPADASLAPPVDHPDMIGRLVDHIQTTVTAAATTPDGKLYDGFQKKAAASSDWEVVYNWVYECFFLGHIPAHVLFPEPSHLKSINPLPVHAGQSSFQQEALRFFYIDHAWLDCFIDGALSCANHVEPQYDNTRLKIKQTINRVLATPVGDLPKTPPVPRYGFVIRSAVVKATPDLKLTVRGWTRVAMKSTGNVGKYEWVPDPKFDPLVRHTKLDDCTILSLFDCLPEQVATIELAQPAHQQRFAFGVQSPPFDNPIKPNVDIVRLFTDSLKAPPFSETGAPPDPDALLPPDLEWQGLSQKLQDPALYNSNTRCIDSTAIANAFCTALSSWGSQNNCFNESEPPSYPNKTNPSSSILGLELNDRACKSYPKLRRR